MRGAEGCFEGIFKGLPGIDPLGFSCNINSVNGIDLFFCGGTTVGPLEEITQLSADVFRVIGAASKNFFVRAGGPVINDRPTQKEVMNPNLWKFGMLQAVD